jgi:hypothetical protein
VNCERCGAPLELAVEPGYERNEWVVRCSAEPHEHPYLHPDALFGTARLEAIGETLQAQRRES